MEQAQNFSGYSLRYATLTYGEPAELELIVEDKTGRVLAAVTVLLDFDENGDEVLSLHLTGDFAAIPEAGGGGKRTLSMVHPTLDYKDTVLHNTVYLMPEKAFDPAAVAVGNPTEINGKNSVRNSAQIAVTTGYLTASEKRVIEETASENTASSSADANLLVLQSPDNIFDYVLRVNNDVGDDGGHAMEKLVLTDNLLYRFHARKRRRGNSEQ